MPGTRHHPDVRSSHDGQLAEQLDDLQERVHARELHVDAAELFRLLGDPTRLAILHALLDADERCVCELARLIGVAENVVSQAMRLLRASGVVRTRREGRRIHYRLADAHVRLMLDLAADRDRRQGVTSDATETRHVS